MNHYSAIKMNEVLTIAATWMNLGNIMLTERQFTGTRFLLGVMKMF